MYTHTHAEKRVEYSNTISVLMESSGAELRSLENARDSCCTLHIVPFLYMNMITWHAQLQHTSYNSYNRISVTVTVISRSGFTLWRFGFGFVYVRVCFHLNQLFRVLIPSQFGVRVGLNRVQWRLFVVISPTISVSVQDLVCGVRTSSTLQGNCLGIAWPVPNELELHHLAAYIPFRLDYQSQWPLSLCTAHCPSRLAGIGSWPCRCTSYSAVGLAV